MVPHPLPVWGGTKTYPITVTNGEFQSTLPVGGGTRAEDGPTSAYYISIHPPRKGRD